MTAPHECVDVLARRAIGTLQGEVSEQEGRIATSLAGLERKIDGLVEILTTRPSMNGARPSFHEFAQEITGSHSLHPIRSWFERKTGQLVIKGGIYLSIALAGWLLKMGFDYLFTLHH